MSLDFDILIKYERLLYILNIFITSYVEFTGIDERMVLWNSWEMWDTEISVLIDAAIS